MSGFDFDFDFMGREVGGAGGAGGEGRGVGSYGCVYPS